MTQEPQSIFGPRPVYSRAWRGQDNAGKPINVIYYGLWGWPSFSYMLIPEAHPDGSDYLRADSEPK